MTWQAIIWYVVVFFGGLLVAWLIDRRNNKK